MDKTQGTVAEKKRIYSAEKLIKEGIRGALYAISGYLCGMCALPFGAYPFGFALLAAADKRAVFVYIGLTLSCLFGFEGSTGILFLGIYTAELLLRALVRFTLDYPFGKGNRQSARELVKVLFCEHVGYRVLCAAVCSASFGLFLLVSGGLLYYDLISLVIATAVAPIAAYAFYCFFCRGGLFRDIGLLALAATCAYSALPMKIYGVSIAALIAVFITLLAAARRGILRGVVAGSALGAIYSLPLVPSFWLCALCAGAFSRVSVNLAVFSSFFTAVGWAFYIKGLSALNGFFAGALVACLAYSMVHKLRFTSVEREGKNGKVVCERLGESELDGIRLSRMNRRMSAISEGLEGLSDFFEEIKVKFSRETELKDICKRAFELSCEGCSEYAACRERGVIETQTQRFCESLCRGEQVKGDGVEESLRARCPRLPDILDEINYNSGARRISDESLQMFVPDYKALSRLLEKSIEGEEDEYFIDTETTDRVCRALDGLGIGVSGAMVYGKRKKTVHLKAAEGKLFEDNRTLICDTLGANLPFLLDVENVHIGKTADGYAMSVSEAESLRVEYAYRQVRAREESEFCGDSMSLFKNRDDRFFALVSDGMGAGRDAAAVSEICTKFIGSMLKVGRMNEELLLMLNGFLCSRCEGSSSECSATLDLMELDLISGETEFFKSGAAPSYVFRDGSLFKLRSCTMPIGILTQIDVKSFRFKLSEGDVVVMMSDGVTGGKDECPWLFDLLRQNINSAGLERTADLVLKYAIGHGSRDDISLAIMRIESTG